MLPCWMCCTTLDVGIYYTTLYAGGVVKKAKQCSGTGKGRVMQLEVKTIMIFIFNALVGR